MENIQKNHEIDLYLISPIFWPGLYGSNKMFEINFYSF